MVGVKTGRGRESSGRALRSIATNAMAGDFAKKQLAPAIAKRRHAGIVLDKGRPSRCRVRLTERGENIIPAGVASPIRHGELYLRVRLRGTMIPQVRGQNEPD